MVWAAAGNLHKQNKNNKRVNRPPETAVIKWAGTHGLPYTKELREQYIKNPPEGMTSKEVHDMSDDELLDMDYFLHELDNLDDDDFGEEGFYIF